MNTIASRRIPLQVTPLPNVGIIRYVRLHWILHVENPVRTGDWQIPSLGGIVIAGGISKTPFPINLHVEIPPSEDALKIIEDLLTRCFNAMRFDQLCRNARDSPRGE
ncbi:hypothetical protein [Burkholderia sp. Ac-20353]|uniref:hypothetical protein n=1 Tax=Burkholderia sp. Ac-20353 TaxID=2703894 RepID=UPI00197B6986|nr:hypothetical protein [Burkholderia sp. Ac-20353]MBN3786120.1 hypothetical protein [Burkholderia sp. Ac-20353]